MDSKIKKNFYRVIQSQIEIYITTILYLCACTLKMHEYVPSSKSTLPY